MQTYTNGAGFDRVFDPVAGEHIEKSFEAVNFNNQVTTIVPIAEPLKIALKSLSFHNFFIIQIPLCHGLNHQSHGRILTESDNSLMLEKSRLLLTKATTPFDN
ncbi:MAG: hypothetical protein MJK12_02965 [Colwellia sp.]|nr:hypothetical protein [Colwellia sp.]